MDNYLDINRKTWNEKTQIHLKSGFYDVAGTLAGKSSLNAIELELLGDISGKKILHLQCHFGQDSISLARMGAHVTGVDFSDAAIAEAKKLANKCAVAVKFIQSDIYALPQVLHETFDLVFTSYGTIGWLPDLDKWAAVVSRFLKADGHFVFAEFHPVVWMFDDDFEHVTYSYFKADAIIEIENGTYADTHAELKSTSITWNHSLSEVLNALIGNGLSILNFSEYNYSPYPCFSHILEAEAGKYQIEKFGDKLPMVYAIKAIKNGDI